MNNNIYELLTDQNKEIIDLCSYTLAIFNLTDKNSIKRKKVNLIKDFNNKITPYWDFKDVNEEGTFENIFSLKIKDHYDIFKENIKAVSLVVGAGLKDFTVEVNSIKKEYNEKEIQVEDFVFSHTTFRFKDIGINEDYLVYNFNFDEEKTKNYNIKIIINNKTGKTKIYGSTDSFLLDFMDLLTGKTARKKGVFMPNMNYIESVIIDNNIELLRILLGDIEYKKSLQPIFDIESLKKDSNDFQNFINHEKIFGVIDLKQLVMPQKKPSSLDKIVSFISPSLKVNNT